MALQVCKAPEVLDPWIRCSKHLSVLSLTAASWDPAHHVYSVSFIIIYRQIHLHSVRLRLNDISVSVFWFLILSRLQATSTKCVCSFLPLFSYITANSVGIRRDEVLRWRLHLSLTVWDAMIHYILYFLSVSLLFQPASKNKCVYAEQRRQSVSGSMIVSLGSKGWSSVTMS